MVMALFIEDGRQLCQKSIDTQMGGLGDHQSHSACGATGQAAG